MSQDHLSSSRPLQLLAPKFSGSRLSSVESLAGLLGLTKEQLVHIAINSASYYHLQQEKVKADGSIREIYSIREPLKTILKRINQKIFKRCEYPFYLKGSLPNCSYKDNAALHTNKGTVITIDASNFFPSIPRTFVRSLWVDFFKFNEQVSDILTALCCYGDGLAQGSPTSSYIANLIFWDVEPLIAKDFMGKGYTYSRYVDDICISHQRRLTKTEKSTAIQTAQKVFKSRGLKVKKKKTKVMDKGSRQEVHRRTVNSNKVCASKSTKDNLRAAVHQLKVSIESRQQPKNELKTRYDSLKGQINHYKSFNKNAAQKLLRELDKAFEPIRKDLASPLLTN